MQDIHIFQISSIIFRAYRKNLHPLDPKDKFVVNRMNFYPLTEIIIFNILKMCHLKINQRYLTNLSNRCTTSLNSFCQPPDHLCRGSSTTGGVSTSNPSVSTFTRELECVQEKAELLQDKLAALEEQHARQTMELEQFRDSKTDLEDMFVTRWQNLEREKLQVVT